MVVGESIAYGTMYHFPLSALFLSEYQFIDQQFLFLPQAYIRWEITPCFFPPPFFLGALGRAIARCILVTIYEYLSFMIEM